MRGPGPRPAGPEVRRRLEARRILRYLGLRAAQACLPMNPLVPLKGVNHLLYSSHTSRCRPGPARPADHFDHHDRSAHHTLRPSCPHPGATRRHSTHSHEPSDPRTTPPPSVCSLPPGRLPQTDWTGPGPDPRKLDTKTTINSPTAVICCGSRTLSLPTAHKPAGYLAAAATRGCKRALPALSGPLPLASARCDACFSHISRTVTYGPRRDGIGSTPMLPCPIPARWLIVGALPRPSPHAALAAQRWSYPCARRSLADHHSFSMASP